ncbi:MAG: hypothetical protein ABI193_19170 [Minicystis sp.]
MAKVKKLGHITIDRVLTALVDLHTNRIAALQSFPYGAFVSAELSSLRDRIELLPEANKGRPLAGPLAKADKLHDGFGGALWHLIEAYLLSPDTSDDLRAAAESIREACGSLDDLTASYDDEVTATKIRKAKIDALKIALALFPIAGNKTLLDWANSFVTAGETIDSLLGQRADTKDRALAGRLRSDAVGVLNQTRRELVRAQKKDPALPADLEDQVFAYFDLLEANAAQEAADEKKAAAKKNMPLPPVTPPVAPI